MGDWAGAFEALGAGLQGKGNEYLLVQEERKKRLDELDEKRLKAMAMDFDASLSDLNAGNVGSAWERLVNRHEQIIKLGGDPTHTENLMKMFKEGRLDEAKAKLTQSRQAAIQDGLIEVPDPKSKYTGIFTTEDGQRAGLNIETNQVEVIPGGEDIRASVGGDATNFSASNEFYDNGTSVQFDRQGKRHVMLPNGKEVTGEEAAKALSIARREQVSFAGDKAAASAEGTTTATGISTRRQKAIDDGLVAADGIPIIKRSLFLMSDLGRAVKTGGLDAWKQKASQWFGVEGADEAELAANLGKNVLAQLKPIFGAQFTADEGRELKQIEASYGTSTEGNIRLLNQTLQIFERAAKRGMKAAKSGNYNDEWTYKEIEDALNFTLEDAATVSGGVMSTVLNREVSMQEIEETAKRRGLSIREVKSQLGIKEQ